MRLAIGLFGIDDKMGSTHYTPSLPRHLDTSIASPHHSSLSRHTSGPPYSTTDLQNAPPVDAGYTDPQ